MKKLIIIILLLNLTSTFIGSAEPTDSIQRFTQNWLQQRFVILATVSDWDDCLPEIKETTSGGQLIEVGLDEVQKGNTTYWFKVCDKQIKIKLSIHTVNLHDFAQLRNEIIDGQ